MIEILANDIYDLLEQLDGMIVRGEKLDLSAPVVQNWA